MKTFAILASVAAAMLTTPAFAAKPIKDNPPSGLPVCSTDNISVNILGCSGFYEGNLLSGSSDKIKGQRAGLKAIGLDWDGKFANVTKISSLKGATTVDFSKADANPLSALYGDTWLGLHFGSGAGFGEDVTAFYKFDAGLKGISSFLLNITKGSSGAVIYRTGSAPLIDPNGGGTGQPSAVPEPSSWMMMIAGFGLVGAARRRRSAVPA